MNTFGDYLFVAGMYRKVSGNQGQNANPEEYVLESYYCGSGIGRDANPNGQTQTMEDGNRIEFNDILDAATLKSMILCQRY